MKKLKDRSGYIAPKSEPHVVSGVTLDFYPVSVGVAFLFREAGVPIIQAIAMLMAENKNDVGTIIRRTDNGSEEIVQPIVVDLAKLRTAQTEEAVKRIVEGLTSDASRTIAARIVIDSLRDLYPRGAEDNPTPESFINDQSLDIPTFMELILGVIKANKGVFGPLAGKAEALVHRAADRMGTVLDGKDKENTASSQPLTPAESMTDGSA